LVDTQFGFPLWHGLRVVAGDATVLRLTLFGKTRGVLSATLHNPPASPLTASWRSEPAPSGG